MKFRADVAMTALYFGGGAFAVSSLVCLYTIWLAYDAGNPDWSSAAPSDFLHFAGWTGLVFALALAATAAALRNGQTTVQECSDFFGPTRRRGPRPVWVALSCSGRVDWLSIKGKKGEVSCTAGCRHQVQEVKEALLDVAAEDERRAELKWVVGAPLLLMGLLMRLTLHNRYLQDKMFDSGVPGETGFFGLSLGHFYFWNRQWSGAELILIYCCLALLYLMLGGPLPRVRRGGASPADPGARRPAKPTR